MHCHLIASRGVSPIPRTLKNDETPLKIIAKEECFFKINFSMNPRLNLGMREFSGKTLKKKQRASLSFLFT